MQYIIFYKELIKKLAFWEIIFVLRNKNPLRKIKIKLIIQLLFEIFFVIMKKPARRNIIDKWWSIIKKICIVVIWKYKSIHFANVFLP